MSRLIFLLLTTIFLSTSISNSYGFLEGDLSQQSTIITSIKNIEQHSDIIKISPFNDQQSIKKRYLIFGSDSIQSDHLNNLYTVNSKTGFFSVGVLQDNEATLLKEKGYHVLE